MTTLTDVELRENLDACLKQAQCEPTIIRREGEVVGLLLGAHYYELFQAIEDRVWGERAVEAINEGYASEEEVQELLQRYHEEQK